MMRPLFALLGALAILLGWLAVVAVETDGDAAGPHTLLIRAYAAFLHLWQEPNPVGPGFVSGEEWRPLTEGRFQVRFYV
ncbi:MAG: hypothetical protein WCP21_06990, partial [Armatimonadota bacterium]